LKITALVENTTRYYGIRIEHGLSLYIETRTDKILFDMGQSDIFYENAKALGIDLSMVDIAILSHGHYDHGGGLRKFLEINTSAPVYIQKDAFLPHYNGTQKYIGLDTDLANNPRIVFTSADHRITPSLSLLSSDVISKDKVPDSGLTEKTETGFVPDDFRHEQYLLIDENGKKILISGCSHKGILDIAEWFRPDVLIGGFHLSKMPIGRELRDIANTLAAYSTEFYTCHCTGEAQLEFMRQYMPNVHALSCGQHIIL